jgi:hypothetical protein
MCSPHRRLITRRPDPPARVKLHGADRRATSPPRRNRHDRAGTQPRKQKRKLPACLCENLTRDSKCRQQYPESRKDEGSAIIFGFQDLRQSAKRPRKTQVRPWRHGATLEPRRSVRPKHDVAPHAPDCLESRSDEFARAGVSRDLLRKVRSFLQRLEVGIRIGGIGTSAIRPTVVVRKASNNPLIRGGYERSIRV